MDDTFVSANSSFSSASKGVCKTILFLLQALLVIFQAVVPATSTVEANFVRAMTSTKSQIAYVLLRILVNIGLISGATVGVNSLLPATDLQDTSTTEVLPTTTTATLRFDTFGRFVLPDNIELVNVDIYDLSGAVGTEATTSYEEYEEPTIDYQFSTVISSLLPEYDSGDLTTTTTPRFKEFTTNPKEQDTEPTLWTKLNLWTTSIGPTGSFFMGATIAIIVLSVIYGVVRAVQGMLASNETHINVYNQPPPTPCPTRQRTVRQDTIVTPTTMEEGASALMRPDSHNSFTSEATEMTDFQIYDQVDAAHLPPPPPPPYPTGSSPNTAYVSMQTLMRRMKK